MADGGFLLSQETITCEFGIILAASGTTPAKVPLAEGQEMGSKGGSHWEYWAGGTYAQLAGEGETAVEDRAGGHEWWKGEDSVCWG